MTRGKHGISAAARQAVGERDQQIEAYQHNIRKLTAENGELRQKLADQQAAHSQTVRVLKAERDEGLSPQVTALQRENVRLTEKADLADRQSAELLKHLHKAKSVLITHFVYAHGLTNFTAAEECDKLIPEVLNYLPVKGKTLRLYGEQELADGDPLILKVGIEGDRKIRKARGVI